MVHRADCGSPTDAVAAAAELCLQLSPHHNMRPCLVDMLPHCDCVAVGSFCLQGQIVQRTGNFAGISVLFGCFLIFFGIFLIGMKYAIRWHQRKRTAKLAALRVGNDGGSDAAAAAAAQAGMAAGGGMDLGGKGTGGVGPDADAAAAGGLGALVVSSPKPDGGVRPRTAVGVGHDRV